MGLFSSIKSAVSTVVAPIAQRAVTTLNTISAAVTRPVTFISSPSKAVEQFVAAKPTTNALKTIVNVGSVAAIVAAPSRALGVASSAGNVIKNIVTKHPIASTVAGLVGIGVVREAGVGESITKGSQIGEDVFDYTQDVGSLIVNPSISGGIDVVQEHPVLAGLSLAVPAYATAKTFGPTITQFRTSDAIREQTEAIREQGDNNINSGNVGLQEDRNDYKDQIKIIEAQTDSQIKILEAQTKQYEEVTKLTPSPAVVAPLPTATGAPAGTLAPKKSKKKKKKKKKKKPKKKKKTRRSKKKSKKKKKKSIKRRKN